MTGGITYTAGPDRSPSYQAFAGPDGVYGLNASSGQVYKYDADAGKWDPLKAPIP